MVKIGDRVLFRGVGRVIYGQVWSQAPGRGTWYVVTIAQKVYTVHESAVIHAVPIRGGDARQAALAA